MAAPKVHPATQFAAPSTILHGTALKDVLSPTLVSLIGQSLAPVVPGFQKRRFEARANADLETLELKDRARQIARVMAELLPQEVSEALPLLVKSLGPELTRTEGNGLAVFFYFPHAEFIAEYGVTDFSGGMQANYELTKRFTAEFSIRPFLVRYQAESLQLLSEWATDANPHVRRLVSEGTRPRLPWAMRLPEVQRTPQLTIPLLERLKDDEELYVRRSVANHLGDIAKDHLEVVLDLCERWLKEVRDADESLRENRHWLIRHALRYPAKKENSRALRIRELAARQSRDSSRNRLD